MEAKKTAKESNSWIERLLFISDRLIGPGEEGGMNVVHFHVHVHVVNIGDADGASKVTAYVVVLLVGFVVDFGIVASEAMIQASTRR